MLGRQLVGHGDRIGLDALADLRPFLGGDLPELGNEIGVELAARPARDFFHGILEGLGRAIVLIVGNCIESVNDAEQAGTERDGLTGEAIGIA